MAREMTIDNVRIADDTECYVVAEVGHNHQGSLEKAKEIFLAARDCGAHAVKLQKRNNRELYTRSMYESPYDNENSYGKTYGDVTEKYLNELEARRNDAAKQSRDSDQHRAPNIVAV